MQGFFSAVSPNSYMSTAWSSPWARVVEPSPEQHASRRQPIDMSNIPCMLLTCTWGRLKSRTHELHPGDTPELNRFRMDMEDAVILLRRSAKTRLVKRPGAPKRIRAVGGRAPKRRKISQAQDKTKGRSERYQKDNLMILTIDLVINLGEEMLIVFLDLAGAFDSCSWRALDRALKKAGASAISQYPQIQSQDSLTGWNTYYRTKT